MPDLLQQTLKASVSCTGIGLHSGREVSLTLHPAPEDSGITFARVDLPGAPAFKACLENVVQTQLATTLGTNGVTVATVEHLMSALAGLGVDNARVEVSAAEVPIMDGSSAPFVQLLKSVGLKAQDKPKSLWVVRKALGVTHEDKSVSVAPAREFAIHYTITYDHPLIKTQSFDFSFSNGAFEYELSPARTFGFLSEVANLKKNGFARGGSLDNAVVIAGRRILNEEGLRFEDEFIRHKVLDFIGDLSLVGGPLIGRFTAHKSGHTLNHTLLAKLFSTPGAVEKVALTHPDQAPAPEIRPPAWRLQDPVQAPA